MRCSIEQCPEVAITRGWCKKHYVRWIRHGSPDRGYLTVEERFWSKVLPGEPDDCWPWQGSIDRGGYGQFWVYSKMDKAHRIAYFLGVGPIPPGLTIDHLCRNRRCVNPDHLEAVTNRENGLRSPISPTAINARKTECIYGHPLDINTARGTRACRTCANRRNREYHARKKVSI